jgi:hypothetical protein
MNKVLPPENRSTRPGRAVRKDREGRLSTTGNGRLSIRKRITGHRAAPRTGNRRRDEDGVPPEEGRRWNETLSSAAVILAGVLVVVGFGFVASRAMRSHSDAPNVSVPQAPALGEVTLPSSSASQGLIPLTSPSPSSSPSTTSPSPSLPPSSKTVPPADVGAISISTGGVAPTVNLTAEGTTDWVHWGEQSTFSLERDKQGGFAILEGAPTAPRFRHALSPQKFSWTGGDPVDRSDGTTTGIRTCGKGNGFNITAPAGNGTRTLRLYVGIISGRGELDAKLTTGSATASTTIEQKDGAFHTAVLTLKYRAPKDGKISLRWTTTAAFGTGCGGVALQAATLR